MPDSRQYAYQDPTLTVHERVDDLLPRMSIREKAGLMFHPRGGHAGFDEPGIFGSASTQHHIRDGINHFNTLQSGTARHMAAWHNAAQAEALRSRWGIPVTFSTDPRHAFGFNPGTSLSTDAFSKWPEALGFGALNDPDLIRAFGDTVRREYLSVGIRVALHPQVDLATDPRWARATGTYGEDVEIVTKLAVAFLEGLQGRASTSSVAGMVKHFPGGGAQKDGEDPHLPYGREQVYPGGKFDLHLEPFVAAVAAGATQMMPYYGMPVGTEYEEVGFGFNHQILTELLRDELGFTGIVCADWSIVTRNFWGVEHLSEDERMIKAVEAGVDQFGGEYDVDRLERLISSGALPPARIDASARRLLAEKFRLGLFDAPFVDEDAAELSTGTGPDREAGVAAQAAAVTVLVNQGGAALPLSRGIRVYAEGIAPDALARYATVAETPDDADVAVIRLAAPWEQRGEPGTLESYFHAGSLAFSEAELDRIRRIGETVPTLVDVYLDRPALLGALVPLVNSLTANFGASDDAILRVLFGEAAPVGRLPFDIPSSQEAIVASRPDVPFDTADPTFRHGFGISV